MSDRADKLAQQLERNLQQLIAETSSLEINSGQNVYDDGPSDWAVIDVIHHLATAETEFLSLFHNILEGGEGVSTDFSVDKFNEENRLDHSEMDIRATIQIWKNARQEMIQFVQGLEDDQLDMMGRHPFLGISTLSQMIKLISIHALTHFRDVPL